MLTRSEAPAVPLTAVDAKVRISRAADLSDADLSAWSDLAARAIEPNPFFEPAMVIPATRLYPDVEVALIESGSELIGALPVERSSRWRRVPVSSLAAWRHRDSYLGTPLLAPGAADVAVGALLDAADAALVAFELTGTGGPVEAALRQAAADRGLTPVVYEEFERAALRRRPEPTYLDGRLSKHRARELRRHRRQVTEMHGGLPVTVHDRSGDPGAIAGYLRAEAAGWKAQHGTHFAASEPHTDFFGAVCERFASAGRLQLLVLSCGDVDIAWKVNFVAGDTVYCFKIAYEPAFARYSPGIQLELDFVDMFHGMPYAWSDSCAAPDNEMINRLWPDRRTVATILVPTGGSRGAAARHALRAVMAARRRIRRTNDQAA
jgi:CelD/BcsL family acetyltransferase involved in cellulose biosynthesis